MSDDFVTMEPREGPVEETTVWSALSILRVFEENQVEQKGRYNYLRWQSAWRLIQDHFPGTRIYEKMFRQADGSELDVMYYRDGSASVTTVITVPGDEPMEHTYPVIDSNNRAIKNPDAFAINKARRRSQVKCLAFLGLGLHIYEGAEDDSSLDDAPAPGLEAESQESDDAFGVDGFIDCMYSLGVKISDVHDFVKKQRDSKLNDLSPGDLKTLQDFIVNAEKADNNWRV
jgi:hypothetical protein